MLISLVRFEAITTVLLTVQAFWVVTPCRRASSYFLFCLTLNMMALGSFETSSTVRLTTRRLISEDTHLPNNSSVLQYAYYLI